MKRLNFKMMLVLLVAAFAMASCQKESKSAQLIPTDALMVMRWDVKQTLLKSKATESNQLKEKLNAKIDDLILVIVACVLFSGGCKLCETQIQPITPNGMPLIAVVVLVAGVSLLVFALKRIFQKKKRLEFF